jgi:hypothetical protein
MPARAGMTNSIGLAERRFLGEQRDLLCDREAFALRKSVTLSPLIVARQDSNFDNNQEQFLPRRG